MIKSQKFGTRTLIGALAVVISSVSLLSPAQAVPTQGGTEGRIFTSNMAHGAVYTGDFATPPGPETIFWQEAGSNIDSVATTLTRVAWSSDPTGTPSSSAIFNKVLIANVALTAANPISVSFDSGIKALTADPANERFYAVVGTSLWAFDSDGTDKTLVFTAPADEFDVVEWGLAIDGVNHKAYVGSEGYIFAVDLGLNNVTGSNIVELYRDLGGVDGIAVDAAGGKIYWANYDPSLPGIARANLDGSGSQETLFQSVIVEGGAEGNAPSGVILNAQLGKIYFTVEQGVYESNLDGTGIRNLYYRGQTSSGYENIGIAFGSWNFGSITNPTVTTVSPASGSVDGGTTVTITGTGFQAGAVVLIGGVACTVVTRTDTQITCTTGAHVAGLVDVVVTNTDAGTVTKSNAYTYVPNGVTSPTITTVSPASGSVDGGTTVTITGTGFQAGAVVLIGGVECTVVTRTATQITCTTGAHVAALVDVVVTNTDTGTVTKSNAYTYVPNGVTSPTVTTVSPSSGSVDGGTTVTIAGTGFQDGAVVLIGGVECTVVTRTATQITCTTGAHVAALVDVVVTNTDTGTVTKSNAYTYVPNGVNGPTITTVSPASGPTAGGTTITIYGTGFKKGVVVTVGGVQCKVLIRVPTKITCKTGAHVAGLVDVVVTNTDTGTVTKNNAFTFIAPAAAGTKTIKKTVYFGSSSSKLSASAAKTLRDFAALVPAGATNIKIKIVGFVQPSPDKANDGVLSLARAKSIRVALSKAGVNGAWIVSGEGRATGDPVKARRGSVVITYTVVPA